MTFGTAIGCRSGLFLTHQDWQVLRGREHPIFLNRFSRGLSYRKGGISVSPLTKPLNTIIVCKEWKSGIHLYFLCQNLLIKSSLSVCQNSFQVCRNSLQYQSLLKVEELNRDHWSGKAREWRCQMVRGGGRVFYLKQRLLMGCSQCGEGDTSARSSLGVPAVQCGRHCFLPHYSEHSSSSRFTIHI